MKEDKVLLAVVGISGGVTARPETMCHRRNVLGPLVPKLIVPCDTISLD